jgi:hypothetical protein
MAKRKSRIQADGSTEPTRYIREQETLRLWVAAGGRCERCNKYLLAEEKTEFPINLAQRAHIAGWKDSPGSPRGSAALPVPVRNTAENLILLCYECHKLIDDTETRHLFPLEALQEIKREHEDRVFHLTAMAKDRDTAVLRVFGAVRGSIPEMARDVALRTVVYGTGRYAQFPLAPDRHGIEINLTNMPEPERADDDAYWKIGMAQIDADIRRLGDAVRSKHVRHLSVFAIARIPLLVYLGYVLDDKIPTDLYQKHRGEGEGWVWPEDGPTVQFQIVQHREGQPGEDVALMLPLSGAFPVEHLPARTESMAVFEIRPVGIDPNPSLFRSRATLDAFSRTYQDLLAQLERTNKDVKVIHLFPAVPITAAIVCGRHLMKGVHPALTVYDRIGGVFTQALTVNER